MLYPPLPSPLLPLPPLPSPLLPLPPLPSLSFPSLGCAPDPKERMIEAVRHFLSSFHTARKVQYSDLQHVMLLDIPPLPPPLPSCPLPSQGTIAKKPYNPVLGEIFQCYWDLPGDDRREVPPEGEALVRSGPVPFAHPTSFTFVAEQVSHHPPGEPHPPAGHSCGPTLH